MEIINVGNPSSRIYPLQQQKIHLEINATHAVKIAKPSIKRSSVSKMREFILQTTPMNAMDVEKSSL